VNSKQKRTLESLFSRPIPADIKWTEIESFLIALSAELNGGSGSHIRVELNGKRAVFHRPHPQNNLDKGAVRTICQFLDNAGVKHG
jgi:hypothetical protein